VSKETYYSVKRDLIQYKYLLFIEADSMLRTQEPVLYQAQRESERERERALLGTTAHNRDFFFPVFYHAQRNYSVKRDLIKCQKRPITVSKETYYSVKRDLLQCQKRPITVSKETFYSVKRDLLQCQKRPNTVQILLVHRG
jgi:hypothetical protein